MQPENPQTWTDRIVIDENILTGKPVIKGTRLAVEFIIDLLAHGWSEGEILENYPGIVCEDIRACLAYASAVLHAEKVYTLPTGPPNSKRKTRWVVEQSLRRLRKLTY